MRQALTALFTFLFIAAFQGQIQLLRYNDNFEDLKSDTAKKKGSDKLKYIRLSEQSRVSFGGEVREQYQYYNNSNFGDHPPGYKEVPKGQVWQRVMLHTNLELGTRVRLFAQANSTFRFLNPNPLTPEIDENQLSLHQAFIDLSLRNSWSVRAGRQEISYGNHRLITFREGPNTRLAFDALLWRRNTAKEKFDLFIMTPVISKPGISDDVSFKDLVVGMYNTKTLIQGRLMLDLYSLSLNSKRRQYNYVAGEEFRQTYGFRLFSENDRLNYELEANYQNGKFNQLKISAYSISADLSYKLHHTCSFILGLAGNYSTGDKSDTDGKLNTYNPLFSRPQYGLTAPIGVSNIVNITPYIKFRPIQKLYVFTGVYIMRRQNDQDGIYSPGAIQVRPAHSEPFSSKSKAIGTLFTVETSYSINKHLSLALDASFFFAGRYIKQTGKGQDISYLSFKAGYKF